MQFGSQSLAKLTVSATLTYKVAAMLRYRRYRVFLVFAVVAIFALYQLSAGDQQWDRGKYSAEYLRTHLGLKGAAKDSENASSRQEHGAQKPIELDIPAKTKAEGTVTPPPHLDDVQKPKQQLPEDKPVAAEKSSSPIDAPKRPTNGEDEGKPRVVAGPSEPMLDIPYEAGQGRQEVEALPSYDKVHYNKPTENYPVASTKALPTGTPKHIPQIQYDFKNSEIGKRDEEKLKVIKDAFMHTWSSYKKLAWGKDELRPVSGKSRDPFNGWGATLVDSLDTLWMMGLKDEFEEAVKKVEDIDFTTSPRQDIPVFETTIRYLGGLLSAYDISGRKHMMLLKRAEQLGDVLYGAFDTPNRMPIPYFYWRP